jgi:hypothetical protein
MPSELRKNIALMRLRLLLRFHQFLVGGSDSPAIGTQEYSFGV